MCFLHRFGNIMIWGAPSWSPASVQFTHGFPRKMIAEAHGGFLPGNVIVSAAASNLCLRRMAVCDVASLVGQLSVAGVGLNYASLLNLRYAAIKYQRTTYLPRYLLRGMMEMGMNFATMEPVEPEALQKMADAVVHGWREPEETSGSEAMLEQELDAELLTQIGHEAAHEDAASAASLAQPALTMLLCSAVDMETTYQDCCSQWGEEEGRDEAAQVATGARRKPKRKRRAASSSAAARGGTPTATDTSGEF